MSRFYEPDLGMKPDDPFARDAHGRLIRRNADRRGLSIARYLVGLV